jgi:hypothetical protein
MWSVVMTEDSAQMNRESNGQRHMGYVDMHYALKVHAHYL